MKWKDTILLRWFLFLLRAFKPSWFRYLFRVSSFLVRWYLCLFRAFKLILHLCLVRVSSCEKGGAFLRLESNFSGYWMRSSLESMLKCINFSNQDRKLLFGFPVVLCRCISLMLTSSTSASVVLLLFLIDSQHINTCWVSFNKRNKTMP